MISEQARGVGSRARRWLGLAVFAVFGFAVVGLCPTRTLGQARDIAELRYVLEGVRIVGNERTRSAVVRRFIPLRTGDVLDVEDPQITQIRWRLLGTGWFSSVQLRLERGHRPGRAILVVQVEERNTLRVRGLSFGVSKGIRNSEDLSEDVVPYGGLSIGDSNLLGLGMGLSLTTVLSAPQQGIRAKFSDLHFLGSDYLLRVSGFFNNAREFFGNDPVVAIRCPPPDPSDPEETCPPEVQARNAVVLYKRYGWSLGSGHDLGSAVHYTLDWQGEIVDVGVRPDAAVERRGAEERPIDFAIEEGVSFISSARFAIAYDGRDDPVLPSHGTYARFQGDLGTELLASDYDFLRIQALVRRWFVLPWGHSLRLGAFGGVVFGRPPFFYKFFASDLSDLIPSRVLEMSVDRRAPPNLLGTAVEVMRSEEIAGRIDLEYGIALYRGHGGVRAVNAYLGGGVYALADPGDLRTPVRGFDGLAVIPIDLTFDVGVRADTDVGVFELGFSSVLGFFTL